MSYAELCSASAHIQSSKLFLMIRQFELIRIDFPITNLYCAQWAEPLNHRCLN